MYALAGFLSSGAPAGLLGMRLAKGRDSIPAYHEQDVPTRDRYANLLVGMATAVVFAAFGYILGRQADQLAELSETDPLTALLNARGFTNRLDTELKRAKRSRESISLLFLDLDGLKDINDRHGHRAGSAALRQVAGVIRSELRASDAGARWGGDEFMILAPSTASDAALALAERIRRRISEQVAPWSGNQSMTVSIGVATLNGSKTATDADSVVLMRAADNAMYEAKKRGKNSVVAAESSATDTRLQAEEGSMLEA
jgi:two-component system cell cycle response regulator